jgi:hypothetical protein
MEANPMSLIKLKGVTKRQKRITELSVPDFKRLSSELLTQAFYVGVCVSGHSLLHPLASL